MYDFLLVLSSLIISIDMADKMMNALRSVKNKFMLSNLLADENSCYNANVDPMCRTNSKKIERASASGSKNTLWV